MDVNNRKTESKTDLKRQDIAIEASVCLCMTEVGANAVPTSVGGVKQSNSCSGGPPCIQ